MLKNVDPRHYAVLRIAMGFFLLITLLQIFPEANFYYSDAGWYPLTKSIDSNSPLQWSVLYMVTTPLGVSLFFILSILASIFMIVGYRTRLATFSVFICYASIITRNHYNIAGQDKLLRLMAFYLWLAPCGMAWSVDSFLKRYRANLKIVAADNVQNLIREKSNPEYCPSWPLLLIQFQICITYLYTGLDKLHGAEWVNGTALMTSLASHTFARFNMDFVKSSPLLMAVMSIATKATCRWETLFSILMLSRWTRWIGLTIGVFVHLGITLLMQVNVLGYLMICSYAALIPTDTFKRIVDWLEKKIKYDGPTKCMAIFDDRSEFSIQTVLLLGMLDFTERVDWVPSCKTDVWKGRAPDLEAPQVESEFHVISPTGQILKGTYAYECLIDSLPLLFPLKALLLIPGGRDLILWVTTYGHQAREFLYGVLRG